MTWRENKHSRDRDCVFAVTDVEVAYDLKLHKLEFNVGGSVLVCKHCTRAGGSSSDGMRLHPGKDWAKLGKLAATLELFFIVTSNNLKKFNPAFAVSYSINIL